jgi:hypothetical protein
MSMIDNVAERIPDVVEKATEGAGELIIAPNVISPAANAAQFPTAQALIGLLCVFCMGLAILRLLKNPVLDAAPEI